jgi:hypothetical protein
MRLTQVLRSGGGDKKPGQSVLPPSHLNTTSHTPNTTYPTIQP